MQAPDPTTMSLAAYLSHFGTRTGTFTIHGKRYTDLSEVEWRLAHDDWVTPRPVEAGEPPISGVLRRR